MEDARFPDHNRQSDGDNLMIARDPLPSFDESFPELNQLILDLVRAYQAGHIPSWAELDERVKGYFTPARMKEMEAQVPGWKRMASYSEGVTLTHIMCVFLGLFMLPEFQSLTSDQQQMAKWIVLLHDVGKRHMQGNRDSLHAFRSAAYAANTLPGLGFPATEIYPQRIKTWSAYTVQASILADGAPIQDNRKLPYILGGIEDMFGETAPAAWILKTVLLHMSIDVVRDWPQAAPLRDLEIQSYITPQLEPLLKAMMLADNEGWSLFDPHTRARQRSDTLQAFERVGQLIS